VIQDGVVLNKDGSLLAGFEYRGRDFATLPVAEVDRISAVINAALSKLGNEWMLHCDATRIPARGYSAVQENAFPDPVSRAIDAERRQQFGAEGVFFESVYTLYFTYLPPSLGAQKASAFFSIREQAAPLLTQPGARHAGASKEFVECAERPRYLSRYPS